MKVNSDVKVRHGHGFVISGCVLGSSHAKMATECPELDSRQASVRRSSSKSFKGIARIFKSDVTKTCNMKIRIPSFRENRKHYSPTKQQRQVLQEPENLLKEIPALDFQKLKADLYVDLAYTNNLLRQRVHRDNLTNLVAQITECLRLIRCRVATAAAYIQTDGLPTLPTSASASNVVSGAAAFKSTTTASKPERHYYSENRVILEAVSRFENAYVAFAGWLTELTTLNPPPMEVLPITLGRATPAGQPSLNSSTSATTTATSKKGTLRVTLPLTRPPSSSSSSAHSPDSPHPDNVATPDDVGEIMARGNACFLAIQTAAESVFLSLEASGCTRPTTPQALSYVNGARSPMTKAKQSGFLLFHFPRATPTSNVKSTGGPATDSMAPLQMSLTDTAIKDSKSLRGGLTLEDRRLLAQLWSQMEPTGDSPPPPPPPKPPLSLESPRWSAGESLADLPPSPLIDCLEPGYTNVRADAKLNAYLRSLAEAVQLAPISNGGSEQMEESIYSDIDSPGAALPSSLSLPSPPPPDPPPRDGSRVNGSFDLNSLNLPHADDSDASEKENEDRNVENEAKGEADLESKDRLCNGSAGGLRLGPLMCTLNSKMALLPPPPPPLTALPTIDTSLPHGSAATGQSDTQAINVRMKNKPPRSESWEPLELTTLPNSIVTSLAKCKMNPLSDTSMQGEVLNAVQRMQSGSYKEGSLQDVNESESPPHVWCVEQIENGGETGTETPCCHAETKSDTEDDFEIIFANGKKYKRYFKRHIVFRRHICRQIVLAPSLPDGSGPDLSRQVSQGPPQVCRLDSMPTCLAALKSLNCGHCPSPSRDMEDGCLQSENDGGVASTSTTAVTQGEESSTASSSCSSSEKPPVPPIPQNSSPLSSTSSNTLTSYMYKFGRSEPQDASLESRICRSVADFFHTKWCKRESAQGPHDRSKTVAYVHKYSQPTAAGPPIQHNTCAQQTCRVRMVGGLEELKCQTPSIPIVYTPSVENSVEEESPTAVSSPSPTVSTLPRSTRGRSLSRGPPSVIDRRNQRMRPTSNLLLPLGELEMRKTSLKIEVPSSSQPLLTDLAGAPEIGFHEHRRRLVNRKGSLESSTLETETEVDPEANILASPICLVNVELPSVKEAERLHPLLMELDATPYLELDSSNSENELQVQAGTTDALIVYATSLGRSHRSFLLTLDVFLVMYRTFVTLEELISLLVQRYLLFQSSIKLIATVDEKTREKICNVVVSYLIRVISQLSTNLNTQIYSLLRLFQERVMDDGYGGLARALDFTLSNQLKRCQQGRISTQSQETTLRSPNSAITSAGSPLISSQTSGETYSSPSANTVSLPGVCVRRSHSIGAVAGATVSLPSSLLKNGGFKSTTTAVTTTTASNTSSGSARNSFSIGHGGESSLQSSPTTSTAALSDIDFEATSVTGTTAAGGRSSTASCFSSPASSRRLLGPSVPIPIATLRRHSRNSASGGPRRVSLLDIPAKHLAEQITYLESEKYSRLTLEELLDIKSLAALKAPVMAACAAQFTALSNWAATLLLAPPPSQRERHAVKLLKVMNYLHSLKNFNSFLAILCAFLLIPENVFSKKTRARLTRLRPYMQPPHFSTYRRELAEASPPLIPYLGLTLQNLIALEQINPLFLSEVPKGMRATYKPEHGPIVNFWRSWKHFLIINFFVKQYSADGRAAQYDIKPDLDILDFIADFKRAYPDFALRELINRRKRETS
ncbi:Rap guanine nucleotide exchange factor 1 [Taenia crassiceps]|uniref:Rap guanine nucleotide exchange factor 1 n=1 Tax=Taenia crassiceps TaxID=6207 RepID=A0ABR4QHJ5_9CEST